MNEYLATFHTHFAAMCTARALGRTGVTAQLMPVPRALSASCGTCIRYFARTPCTECMAKDTECIYIWNAGSGYEAVCRFE